MDFVDRGDQRRTHMGGWATKGHFKKWYKKAFLAILDLGILNGHIAWNLAAEIPGTEKRKLER